MVMQRRRVIQRVRNVNDEGVVRVDVNWRWSKKKKSILFQKLQLILTAKYCSLRRLCALVDRLD